MAFKPTKAQQAAIETTDKSIVLNAGAGSGKTRVLVQRYLHLLSEGLAQVDQILAITFTNKAAGEMKERIMEEVFKQVDSSSSPEELTFWKDIKENLNQARISTFHGFCGQLLREYPIEAGIDPYFQTLDQVQSDELLDEAIEEVFLKKLEETDSPLITLAREFGIYIINDLLKDAYLAGQRSMSDLDQIARDSLAELAQSRDQLQDLKIEIMELIQRLFEINETEKLSKGSKAKVEELERKWSTLSKDIRELTSLEDSKRDALFEINEILKGRVAKAIKEEKTRIKEIVEEEIDLYLADIRAEQLIPPLVETLKLIDKSYREKKAAMNALDFFDLQHLTIKVLKNDPKLSSQLQDRFNFIMVDEFQDTNPVQEELVRLIIGGSIDAALEGNKLFIVGDPKQSIYRFRGADVTVFKKLETEISQIGKQIIMDKNFRSRKKIIDFVNHFFDKIFGTSDSSYDMDYQSSSAFRNPGDDDTCLEMVVLDKNQLKEINRDPREEEAEQLALRIREMVDNGEELVYGGDPTGEESRPVKYGDICYLFQALTNVQLYEQALQRHNIPYSVVNGRGFYQRQEIRDTLNLLKILDNRYREIEWVGILRSPFCGLSDEDLFWLAQRKGRISQVIESFDEIEELDSRAKDRISRFLGLIEKLRARRGKVEISILLKELLEESGYLQLMLAHPQAQLIRANLDKFIGLAREYEKRQEASLAGFIRYIERLEEGAREGMAQIPGDDNEVKLMSVHQSKGLEFPVVIIPDCHRRLINYSGFPDIFFDTEFGLGMKVKDPLMGKKVSSSLHSRILEEEKIREIAERKRLLYVAVTRARDYMIMSGAVSKFKAKEIDKGSNWFDWLINVFSLENSQFDLPDTLEYGPEGCGTLKIRVPEINEKRESYRHSDKSKDNFDLHNWQEEYRQLADSAQIRPKEKRGLYNFAVTALLKYERCPRWYYHSYLQKMPASLKNPVLNLREELSPAEKGTLIHFICERIEGIDQLNSLVESGIDQLSINNLNKDANNEIVTELKPYIEGFLEREDKLNKELEFNPVRDLKEYDFNLVINNVSLRGTIDRVLTDENQGLVIDYKTDQIRPAGQMEAKAREYQLQLEFYALALHQLMGLKKVTAKIHFLRINQYWEVDFTGKDFKEIERKISRISSEIIETTQQGVNQGMKVAFKCCQSGDNGEICPYLKDCSYSLLCEKMEKNN